MENRQWILAQRPKGAFDNQCVALQASPLPVLGDGQFLVKNKYLSCDPTQLMWMQADTYVPAIELEAVIRSLGIGEVVESRHPDYSPGDIVHGLVGWQEYAIVDDKALFPTSIVPTSVDPLAALSVFGLTGLTAYYGMHELGNPQAGQTVLVSGAAGATGSVAAQIARIRGAKVIALAGSKEKCAWLKDKGRVDVALNYREIDLHQQLKELAPSGVDLFFDNVGGKILDATLMNLALGGKILLCGSIATYENPNDAKISNTMQLVIRRGTMQGFLVSDFLGRMEQGVQQLAQWVQAGLIHYEVDVQQGFEDVPKHYGRIFKGLNLGKQIIAL